MPQRDLDEQHAKIFKDDRQSAKGFVGFGRHRIFAEVSGKPLRFYRFHFFDAVDTQVKVCPDRFCCDVFDINRSQDCFNI